jgi:hypothetical protein
VTTEPLTFGDVIDDLVPRAAYKVGRQYDRWGFGIQDASQEMLCWAYGKGTTNIRRWLAAEPQQIARLHWALVDVGRTAGEKEKAARCGYDSTDIMWYTPALVEGLMPLVLDETYDGIDGVGDQDGKRQKRMPNEGGDLLAYVMDIRRAISQSEDWVGDSLMAGDAGWDSAISVLINRLGGEAPHVGKRRVMSNAASQYQTRQQEAS